MRRALLLLVLVGLGPLGGCASSGTELYHPYAPKLWHLEKILIDENAIRQGVRPPFDSTVADAAFGQRRWAEGEFRTNEEGKVVIDVRAVEEVMGIGGRRGENRYHMIRFVGVKTDADPMHILPAGDRAAGTRRGEITELRIEIPERATLRVTARAGDAPHPYIYIFTNRQFPLRGIRIP